ncbi:MAG: hypothetical protein U0324_19000 [Polyangiales bacterium]
MPGHAQRPAVQAWPVGHMLPHMPQLVGSVCRSTQRLSAGQKESAALEHAHMPRVHAWPVGHIVPHAPQLVGSV